MARIDKKRAIQNQAIDRFAKFVKEHRYNTDFASIAKKCGVTGMLDSPEHEAVSKAQNWGELDLADAVARFLQDVFDENERIGLLLVHEIASSENLYDGPLSQEARNELAQILALFENQDIDIQSLGRNLGPVEDYITVTYVPDDFYRRLIDEINHLYEGKHVFGLAVLRRKLLENLVIDILRKRYGTTQLSLYFDPHKGRFQDFAVLIKNLKAKKADFLHITSSLDDGVIRRIEDYRETGNSAAHSLDAYLSIEAFSRDKEQFKYLVDLLLSMLQKL